MATLQSEVVFYFKIPDKVKLKISSGQEHIDHLDPLYLWPLNI